MTIRDERLYIEDILDSITKLDELTHRYSKQQFDADWVVQFAILKCLEIIGESSNKLPNEFRARYQEIPWRKLIALRNIAVHAYYDIDLDRIWQTITRDLPELRDALAAAPEVASAA